MRHANGRCCEQHQVEYVRSPVFKIQQNSEDRAGRPGLLQDEPFVGINALLGRIKAWFDRADQTLVQLTEARAYAVT